jgi:riboflavin synthase
LFSGIIEATGRVVEAIQESDRFCLIVQVPQDWTDLKTGDSVAHNGVCLTVEKLELYPGSLRARYTAGLETLKITGWSESLKDQSLNLERSLKLGDRVHGHLVLGHVDGRAVVTEVQDQGSFRVVEVALPKGYEPYIWKKGSITLNGVSLTINEVSGSKLQVGLIPETLERTNLKDLSAGDEVLFEVDNFARGLVRQQQLKGGELL